VAYEQSNYDLAIESYRQAVNINPQYVEAWNNLGLAYTFNEDFKESIECYEEALKFELEDPVLYDNIGFSYYALEDFEMAISFYEKALAINADNTTSLKKLGKIYCDVYKEHKKALTYFKRVNELDPSDNDVKIYLSECNKSLEVKVKRKEN